MATDVSDVTTPAAKERPRVVPTWIVILVAAVVLLAMLSVAPRGRLRQRVASVGAPSDLSAAYLEAWSKSQPDNEEFLSLLGAQYSYLGRADDALRIATRMDALGTDNMRRSATMLRLAVAEQRTFAIPEDDPRRGPAIDALRTQLEAAAALTWAPRDLAWLAQRAVALGLPQVALKLYTKLSKGDPDGRQNWDTQITRYALQVGDYRAAADAWFRQQASARTLDEQRRCFIAGVRTLQSGDLLDEALAAADQHVGALANDPATLVELLTIARAADKPARVDYYAKQLARFVLNAPGVEAPGVDAPAVAAPGADAPGVDAPADAAPGAPASSAAGASAASGAAAAAAASHAAPHASLAPSPTLRTAGLSAATPSDYAYMDMPGVELR